MKKPSWIVFCGWSVVFLLAFALAGLTVGSQLRWSADFAAVCVMCLVFAIPMFVLWALASMVNAYNVNKSKIQAEAMARALHQAQPSGTPGAAPAARAPATSPLGLGSLPKK
jgi:hypothetical protein